MNARRSRVQSAAVRGVAFAFWVAGWTILPLALWNALLVLSLSVSVSYVSFLDWAMEMFYGIVVTLVQLVDYAIVAVVLLAFSRGILLGYEAIRHLRSLAPEGKYEWHLGPARFVLWVYQGFVRFRALGGG
jgi:hypothetical protein